MAGSNGPARGHASKGGQKASTQQDVENYFKINEVQQLVNRAVNSVAQEKPADFKSGLSAALASHATAGLAPEAGKKAHTKQDAEEAKKYLEKNNAEAILSEILGKVAGEMPENAANALAEYAKTATGKDAYKPPKAEKQEEEKKEPAEKKGKDEKQEKKGKDDKKAEKAAQPAAAAKAPEPKAAEPKKPDTANLDPKKLKAAIKEVSGRQKCARKSGCGLGHGWLCIGWAARCSGSVVGVVVEAPRHGHVRWRGGMAKRG